jgi:rfaE bifunctional protein kinase chain/domain
MDFDKLFQSFQHCKMAVIGDVMLDSYCWGHVDRISPEAPVPVVLLDSREERIGGAGNVALNLVSMGAPTSVFSVIGRDEAGDTLVSLMGSQGINTSHIIRSPDRKTTNKTRIISRNQQMMRLDAETTADLSPGEETLLIEEVKKFIESENPSAVIFEDYNKGILTEKVIGQLVEACRQKGIITAVDPKRKNFFSYKGVTIFKPNF